MKRLGLCFIGCILVFTLALVPQKPVLAGNHLAPSTGTNGFWECYDDATVDPCHNNINDVKFVSDNNAWAVGDQGRIMHWNGISWSLVPSPTKGDLLGLDMLNPLHGWAVGSYSGSSVILYWDGIKWSEVMTDLGAVYLNDIDMLTTSDGWIVGWNGFSAHWDGIEWSPINTFVNETFKDVEIVSQDNVWAVGGEKILHWSGSNWEVSISYANSIDYLYDIEMIDSNNGWAVGNFNNFYRWDGSSWTRIITGYESRYSLLDLSLISPTDGWAVGNRGAVYRWDGSNWILTSDLSIKKPAYMAVSTYENNGWITGEGGTLLRFDGSSWVEISSPNIQEIFDASFCSTDNGWAVGENSTAIHWNGISWDFAPIPIDATLSSVVCVDENNAWITSGSDLLHWNGIAWTVVQNAPSHSKDVVDIFGSNIWIGGGEYIYGQPGIKYIGYISNWNGFVWTTQSFVNRYIETIDIFNNGLGYSAGGNYSYEYANSTFHQWDGTSWNDVTSITYNMSTVMIDSPSNVWALGSFEVNTQSPLALHWDGVTWSKLDTPIDLSPTVLDISSEGDPWSVGNGSIYHWDGIKWESYTLPVSMGPNSIRIFSNTEGWAVGGNGVILEYKVPSLTINFQNGSPGSYFNLTGTDFPRNQTATISVNGHDLGTVQVGEDGGFTFTLSTAGASEGIYYVTVSVNPSVMIKLTLDEEDPLRTKEGTFTTFDVPAGIGFTSEVFLPLIKR